jgi:hypothetical protein
MSDAKAIVETVIFEELDAGIEGATVYQDVPENAPLDVVILGDMKSSPLGAKDDLDRRISIIIVSMVGAEERAPLLALQRQIEGLLDGKTFERNGWTLSVTFEDDDAVLGGDGATYIGTSAFEVLALSA